jgi:hypothetical protein
MELAAQMPATLACAAPLGVSRTDTEVVERAPRPRTEEVRAETPPTRPIRRRGRALAYVGATLGAALIAWVTLKGPPTDLPVAPATAQAAVPPELAVVPDEPEPPAVAQRQQQTLTARAPTASASEERHRRRGRAERRAPARVALPEVFRTPGF